MSEDQYTGPAAAGSVLETLNEELEVVSEESETSKKKAFGLKKPPPPPAPAPPVSEDVKH